MSPLKGNGTNAERSQGTSVYSGLMVMSLTTAHGGQKLPTIATTVVEPKAHNTHIYQSRNAAWNHHHAGEWHSHNHGTGCCVDKAPEK